MCVIFIQFGVQTVSIRLYSLESLANPIHYPEFPFTQIDLHS